MALVNFRGAQQKQKLTFIEKKTVGIRVPKDLNKSHGADKL